ncbi:MAG: gliding motility-associated C-terminal domain-containing protein [Bacteroidota bacterium]
MKRPSLFFYFVLISFIGNSQVLNNGWFYSSKSNMSVLSTLGSFVDKTDNRYTIFTLENDTISFKDESTKKIINITNSGAEKDYIIVKFNPIGNFLFYFRIAGVINSELNLTFDKNDNLILFYSQCQAAIFTQSKVDLIDSKNRLYKQVDFPNASKSFNRVSLICKLDTLGQFIWINTIKYKHPEEQQKGNFLTTFAGEYYPDKSNIIINSSGEISIHLDFANVYSTNIADTITIINPFGIQFYKIAKNIDVFLTFDSMGYFKYLSEPYHDCAINANYDTRYYRSYTGVGDGLNSYSILSVYCPTDIIFNAKFPINLKTGVNTLLIKRDRFDSIIWAKHLRLDSFNKYYGGYSPKYLLNYDINKQELIATTQVEYYNKYGQISTKFVDSNKSGKINSMYISKYDTNGNLKWDFQIEGIITDERLKFATSFNSITKQFCLFGNLNTLNDTFKIGSFKFKNIYLNKGMLNIIFVATFDSSNNLIFVQLIKPKPLNNSNSNSQIYVIQYSQNMFDQKGRIYLTFSADNNSAIDLPCNLLSPFYTSINYGPNISVLVLDPIKYIDSTACKNMISPSHKNLWINSGLYIDTISSKSGCDSLIFVNLKISNKPFPINISKSNEISCDTPTSILTVIGKAMKYQWYPNIALSDSNNNNIIVNPNKEITYYVTATDSFGCNAVDSISLKINKNEKINALANVFSPNNDGINDCLPIENVANFKEVEFNIFNRWGNEVFSTSNPKACWDGNYQNSINVTQGIYYYVLNGITECNQKVNQHGSITLIR